MLHDLVQIQAKGLDGAVGGWKGSGGRVGRRKVTLWKLVKKKNPTDLRALPLAL